MSLSTDDRELRIQILRAMTEAKGVTQGAADLLGVHKVTLLRAIRRLGLSLEVAKRFPDPARTAYAYAHLSKP